MVSRTLRMLAVGDIVLGPDGESFFVFVKPVLRSGDMVVGQLEVPYTTRDANAVALDRDPSKLSALPSAGFNVLTLAGNHLMDAGVPGVEDTLAWLRDHNLAAVGAGMNITEARRPVVIERNGTRFGFLAYNCVGPEETWATSNKPGCAYVHIITHYEVNYASPGGPPTIYTWAESKTLRTMIDDIHKLRPLCDILIVTLHMGIGHTPIKIAEYEHQVSYAAIDAGADLILGHHAHILKGIQFYKGKAIFHGLNNFVTYVPSLMAKPDEDSRSWARRRKELFGFEPDPEYPTYPFHPEARYTIIAQCSIKEGRISQLSYLPCLVNKKAQPEILKNDERGQDVYNYMDKITRRADLNAQYEWNGDEVLIHE